MRIIAPPQTDPAAFAAFAAALLGGLVGVLAWLIDTFEPWLETPAAKRPAWRQTVIAAAKRAITAHLREAARALRMLIVAQAYARARRARAPSRPYTYRPSSERPGFRRAARRSGAVRRIAGAALAGVHEGSLRERAQRLRDMVTNLEPLIAYVAARFTAMLKRRKGSGLVLTFARYAPRDRTSSNARARRHLLSAQLPFAGQHPRRIAPRCRRRTSTQKSPRVAAQAFSVQREA